MTWSASGAEVEQNRLDTPPTHRSPLPLDVYPIFLQHAATTLIRPVGPPTETRAGAWADVEGAAILSASPNKKPA